MTPARFENSLAATRADWRAPRGIRHGEWAEQPLDLRRPEPHNASRLHRRPEFSALDPDARFLVLGGLSGLAWIRPEQTAAPQPLTRNAGGLQIPWSFAPAGKRLAYHQRSADTAFDLWTVPIEHSANGITAGTPEPFLATPAYETYPSFSLDGKWIAYGSNESGNWEVYVRAFPDTGRKVQVSEGAGRIALWSPNGRELVYRTDGQRIVVVNWAIRDGVFAVESRRMSRAKTTSP